MLYCKRIFDWLVKVSYIIVSTFPHYFFRKKLLKIPLYFQRYDNSSFPRAALHKISYRLGVALGENTLISARR